MPKIVRGRAPLRIDLAGAWTDIPFFAETFGGMTVNAAIDIYVEGKMVIDDTGLAVDYSLNFPVGSGLGTSGALNVLYSGIINHEDFLNNKLSKKDIAEIAYNIERSLGAECGRQDQYGSAMGGVNLFEFLSNENQQYNESNVLHRKVDIDIIELSNRLLLIDTKIEHSSSQIINIVKSNFISGKLDTAKAMFNLKESALAALSALRCGDWMTLGRIMDEQFNAMKELSHHTTNDVIEEIIKGIRPYIHGVKPGGAGGGGCLIVLCRSLENKRKLISENMKPKSSNYLSQFDYYDVGIDMDGVCIWEDNEE